MRTTDITVCLNTPDGKQTFTGRGFIKFPFVVHRPIIGDELRGTGWKVSHLASGRVAFTVATIADANKAIEVLDQHSLFYMPDTDKFMKLCASLGNTIVVSMKAAGYDKSTGRFVE